MRLRWSDQAQFDLDWMYEGVFAACRDFDTTDRYYDGMINTVEAKQFFPSRAQNYGITARQHTGQIGLLSRNRTNGNLCWRACIMQGIMKNDPVE